MSDNAVETKPKLPIVAGSAPKAVVPTNVDEVRRIASIMVQAGQFGKPRDGDDINAKIAQASIVLFQGLELGLTPMQSLNGIAIISGRPSVWGKLARALVRRAGHTIREWVENEGDEEKQINYCEITRKDTGEKVVRKFSITDAKRAKLWSPDPKIKRWNKWDKKEEVVENDSPWHKYWPRMMQHRPFAYAASDACPEALLGMMTAEELQDMRQHEAEEDRGPVMAAPPPPLAADTLADDAAAIREAISQPADPNKTIGDLKREADEPLFVEQDAEQIAGNRPHVDPIEHPAPDMREALEGFAAGCDKAKAMDRLDKLLTAFEEKFDGYIDDEIGPAVAEIYERNMIRISGKG